MKWLKLFKEVFPVYTTNRTKQKKQNEEVLIAEAGRT
jgi:hypothetical protein